jgi:DNA anti-recombination protein RmuC
MDLLPSLLLSVVIVTLLLQAVIAVTVWIVNKIKNSRRSKRARIEAELDRKQAELRATILDLASQLGAEAHEARKALIRESFLASRGDYPRDR